MAEKEDAAMLYYTEYPSPVGRLTLAGDEDALMGLWIQGQKYFLASLPEAPVRRDDLPLFRRARGWLDRYFAGARTSPDELPLAPNGTPFRRKVWRRLRAIPYGETVTYGALAAELGSSPRAVGGAVGHNPISILIPCHRVVGGDGSLTGYAGGLDAKRALLALEGIDLSRSHDQQRRR